MTDEPKPLTKDERAESLDCDPYGAEGGASVPRWAATVDVLEAEVKAAISSFDGAWQDYQDARAEVRALQGKHDALALVARATIKRLEGENERLWEELRRLANRIKRVAALIPVKEEQAHDTARDSDDSGDCSEGASIHEADQRPADA